MFWTDRFFQNGLHTIIYSQFRFQGQIQRRFDANENCTYFCHFFQWKKKRTFHYAHLMHFLKMLSSKKKFNIIGFRHRYKFLNIWGKTIKKWKFKFLQVENQILQNEWGNDETVCNIWYCWSQEKIFSSSLKTFLFSFIWLNYLHKLHVYSS